MRTPHPPSAFVGTARDYLRYRPAYPAAFLRTLRTHAGTSGRGTLLDLACGPGRVAIPMAPHFARVLAVDVDAEMLAVGKQEAEQRGVANISWMLERAEDLQLATGSIELITIGEAFHRLERDAILTLATQWLQPGGGLATLGAEPPWRGEEAWRRVLVEVVNRWTNHALGAPNENSWGGPVDALRAAGMQVQEHQMCVEMTWTCNSIVGFMRSTSIASRAALGDNAMRFEAELRAALLAFEPHDRFASMQCFSCTVGKTSS